MVIICLHTVLWEEKSRGSNVPSVIGQRQACFRSEIFRLRNSHELQPPKMCRHTHMHTIGFFKTVRSRPVKRLMTLVVKISL